MNYLAHGFRHLDDAWFVVGTALPDWLRMLDRRARAPEEAVAPHASDVDPRVASLAKGVLRHHEDDRRFHGGAAFAAARRETAAILRERLASADGHRPSFIAHLLVEVQLDASLAEATPGLLDRYYAALASLAPDEVENVVRRVVPGAPDGVGRLVTRFVDERFLGDYSDAARLVARLGRVLRRARQPALPADVAGLLPRTRAVVEIHRAALLGETREPARSFCR
jgi:hypothetical protein